MFSKSDFQKSTYIKELFSLYYAIKYYQDYILNTIHPLTALADARCLLALNQNKQHEARLQGMNEYLRCLPSGLRLLHITTQYNLCADILTRSFEQAPLQERLTISKKWSQILPPLPKGSEEPVMLTQQQVYAILTSKPEKKFVDCYPIRRPQMSKPCDIAKLIKAGFTSAPEKSYALFIRIIDQFCDTKLQNTEFMITVKQRFLDYLQKERENKKKHMTNK